ncbi:MAG: hypothetical protein IPH85_13880 [Ignavibacteria bacterium]|nr:hypothetical protein [Ignavibacteria bacterium]
MTLNYSTAKERQSRAMRCMSAAMGKPYGSAPDRGKAGSYFGPEVRRWRTTNMVCAVRLDTMPELVSLQGLGGSAARLRCGDLAGTGQLKARAER